MTILSSSVRAGAARRLAIAVFALATAAACGGDAPPPAEAPPPPPPAAQAQAPDTFRVEFETSRGNFVLELRRAWSPVGVDRLYDLVMLNYFADVRFFRVVPGFVAQFGMHGDPATNAKWSTLPILDEPVLQSNRRGTIVFAKQSAPNTRSNQFFINLADNAGLDPQGFSPLGEVVSGMEVVDGLYNGYGDGMDQGRIATEGNAFLMKDFPRLDYIKSAKVLPR